MQPTWDDAERAARMVRDEDGLDFLRVGEFEEPFLGLVKTDSVARNTGAGNGVVGFGAMPASLLILVICEKAVAPCV